MRGEVRRIRGGRKVRKQCAAPCIALSIALGACSSVYLASGSPGTDISPVVTGASAEAVNRILGTSVREWSNASGVTFRLYEFDGGRAPNVPDALGTALFAIVSFGLTEILFSRQTEEDERTGRTRTSVRMIVSFDPRDTALGVFGEFDHLPADGRNPAAARSAP